MRDRLVQALDRAEWEYLDAIRASIGGEPGADRRLSSARQDLDDLSAIVQVVMVGKPALERGTRKMEKFWMCQPLDNMA